MATEISFKEVCTFIKADDPKLVESVDLMLGLVMILTPLVISTPAVLAAPALGLLGVKNELTKIGKDLFERVTAKKDKDNLARQKRMETAYGLLCFTAFFEALDNLLPDIRNEFGLEAEQRFELSATALSRLHRKSERVVPHSRKEEIVDLKVFLPNPADEFEDHHRILTELYKKLTDGFMSFLKQTRSWTELQPDEQVSIEEKVRLLPALCTKYFDAQYFVLATKYEDFFIWSNLYEHRELKRQISQMSVYLQEYIALGHREPGKSDIGLEKMGDLVERNLNDEVSTQTVKAITELNRFYKAQLDGPILGERFDRDQEPFLRHLSKVETFVPQAFRLLKYTGDYRLGDEDKWAEKLVRDDLGTFLLSYLSSPYSLQNLLLILGHPGSGKSLLTEILAAKLLSQSNSPIRIVLRDVLVDEDITSQIERQLRKDLGRSVSWADLADQSNDHPPLIIFDGYDELLQTSGQVISDFLIQLQVFQDREKAIRCPVRIIVTSRITLIDKAQIPNNCTVIRLEDFDFAKQNEWVSIWNQKNRDLFKQKGVRPFTVPVGNPRLLELSRHPLLLLMLAIFDSEENALVKSNRLDRTQLYYKLINRFVERERYKDPSFALMEPKDRHDELQVDIERLGVAALGMFNRKRLHIQGDELEADLEWFKLKKQTRTGKRRPLSPADNLAGSFFFTFESRALRKLETETCVLSSALEFLHTTFGEFLTADFILRQILFVIRSPETTSIQNSSVQAKLFVSLMYTPLHTRPLVLEMIREWLKHKLNEAPFTEEEFRTRFDAFFVEQIRRVTKEDDFATTILTHNRVNVEVSLIGLLAIYSLNLVLLRLIFSPQGFEFNETQYPSTGGNRIWDVMTYLWRAWFTPSSLLDLSSQMSAKRDGLSVHIRPRKPVDNNVTDTWFDSLRKLSSTLADESLEKAVLALIQTGHYSS